MSHPARSRDAVGTVAGARRPDASMDLLRILREEARDPSYAVAAARGAVRRPWTLAAGLLAAGLLFGVAGATTLRQAPAAAGERADLIARITAAEAQQDALRARATELARGNTALEQDARVLAPSEAALRDRLAVQSGVAPVVGPGVRLVVDDGPDADVRGSRVVDADLRMVVNGLWTAGAEAVAINGHRLSSRTPIRNAGDAITVDYRSLSRPYVVEAVGAPTLAGAFADTEGGRWLAGLGQHYGVDWGLSDVRELALGADPGLRVDLARPGKGA